MQRIFADGSFGPTQPNWYGVVLVERFEKHYKLARVLLLFLVTINNNARPDNAEITFLQCFTLTLPLDDDTVLNCVCFRLAMNKAFNNSFNYSPTLYEKMKLTSEMDWYIYLQ